MTVPTSSAPRKHDDAVYSLAFAPSGEQLASAGGSTDGGDTVCRIWNFPDLQLVSELSGHQRQVYGVAFSPNGQTLATSSSDKTIRLWDLSDGTSRVLEGHTSDVYRCSFSPDGRQIVSASQDGSVRLWSVESEDVALVFDAGKKKPLYAAVFSGEGKSLAAVGDDRRLRVWDASQLELRLEREIGRHAVYAVAFSPDHRFITVAGRGRESLPDRYGCSTIAWLRAQVRRQTLSIPAVVTRSWEVPRKGRSQIVHNPLGRRPINPARRGQLTKTVK